MCGDQKNMDHRASNISWLVLSYIFMIIILSYCSCHRFCYARDVIEHDTPIRDNGETLVSTGGRFELGFFTPNGSSDGRRYVGIWYKFSPLTVVWVANRDKALFNTTGVFAVQDGNLHVLDGSTGKSLWSTELETSQASNRTVKLMDSGNLVLREGNELGESLWESFKKPTDTFLPGMEMDADLKLNSWRRKDDPGIGCFTFKQDDQEGENQFITMNKSMPYWKSGSKISSSDKMRDFIVNMLKNFKSTTNNDKRYNKIRKTNNNGTRLVISFDGFIQYQKWDESSKAWHLQWREPMDQCSIFNVCGNFGSCNAKNSVKCKCLPGYKPSYPEKWKSGDFWDGCNRPTPCSENDTFLSFKIVNAGNTGLSVYSASNETECRKECLGRCLCKAYSFQTAGKISLRRTGSSTMTNSCSIWRQELQNVQEGNADGGDSFIVQVRVALSNFESNIDHRKRTSSTLTIVSILVSTVAALACFFISFIIWRRKTSKKQENRRSDQRRKDLLKLDTQRRIKHLMNSGEFEEEDEENIDVPFFDFESILAATDDFSDANKLGEGGYGPVYEGKFPGGQEIAVKRLSSVSGQGLQEFKNEVVLIAKLQHRNLVRLRGYCLKGVEKILLYEYMPNKSLDSFIFDETKRVLLDWEMRFNIILGIARGLLYLHQDSRLRIIHRDLKTSNILLDQDMEPKISDFGLARIVGGKRTEANTERVVGTYGYMSPEYAIEGLFSVKSDVFSFGVVLLEILSGKKNTRLVQSSKPPLTLLGYAWGLWTENKALDMMDPTLHGSFKEGQYLKCVKVGLLCVQEDPSDRPTMSSIITMLDSESSTVPTPQQPAFVLRKGTVVASSSSSSKPDTIVEMTATLEEGR